MGHDYIVIRSVAITSARFNCYRTNSGAARVTLTAYQYNKDFRI